MSYVHRPNDEWLFILIEGFPLMIYRHDGFITVPLGISFADAGTFSHVFTLGFVRVSLSERPAVCVVRANNRLGLFLTLCPPYTTTGPRK